MSLALAANPKSYDDSLSLLQKLIKPNDDIIDVGANIGVYSCTMAHLNGPSGRVWAIEPTPETFAKLYSNSRVNNVGRMLCLHAAVGDKWSSVTVDRHSRDDSQNNVSLQVVQNASLVVQAPLDELISLPATIGLLKIDVEGAELLVLSGASQALQRTRHILIEVFEPNLHRFGGSAKQLLRVLVNAGFDLFVCTGRELTPLTKDQDFSICTDVLGIRKA